MFAVAAALTAVAILGFSIGALNTLELSSVDTRFAIRGAQPSAAKQLVVVGVDQYTFNASHLRWPFPRRYDGDVINVLKRDGAKVIVFDVQFTEPSDPTDDNALYTAAGKAGNLVFATDAANKYGQTQVLGGTADLDAIHALAGDSLLPNDADGRIRRMYYDQSDYGTQRSELKTLAVLAVERYTGKAVSASKFPGDHAWIDYVGPPGTVPFESYWKTEQGQVPASAFKGKIVVIGATEPTLQDVHFAATGGSTLMSGAEIQANAISTILRGFPLQGLGVVGDIALIVLLGMSAPLVNLRWRPVNALGFSVALAGVFTIATQLLFNAGLIVTYTYPLLALVLSSIGALAVNFMAEAFERERVRNVFSRFISEAVVDEVLETSADGTIRLGGVRLVSTVLFSDLRGFTSFAETLDPEVVIAILNRYLTAMSDAILDHDGTLVAYMGDGIFAVFGAPIGIDDHADRALAAARHMLHRLRDFNSWLEAEHGVKGFKMGIGLNTGHVMSGNVGSERRLEYAAIGDTTNTASRLESMTKGTPYQLYMSDSTYADLSEKPDDLVFVDEFEVRGKLTTVKVWGLVEDDVPGMPPTEKAAPTPPPSEEAPATSEDGAPAPTDTGP
jgi:adenylate cyclase